MTRIDRTKLTTASREDIMILVPRLVLGAVLYLRADCVDNLLHIVEFKSEDYDLRMQVGVKETCGKGPLGPFLLVTSENIGHVPPMSLDLGEEFLVCRVRTVRMAGIADHAMQRSTQRLGNGSYL